MLEVIFFKAANKYYFKFNGYNFELNVTNLDYLLNNLSLPHKIEFYKCSRSMVEKIIKYIIKEKTGIKICEVTRYEDKNIIGLEAILLKSRFQEKVLRNNMKGNY